MCAEYAPAHGCMWVEGILRTWYIPEHSNTLVSHCQLQLLIIHSLTYTLYLILQSFMSSKWEFLSFSEHSSRIHRVTVTCYECLDIGSMTENRAQGLYSLECIPCRPHLKCMLTLRFSWLKWTNVHLSTTEVIYLSENWKAALFFRRAVGINLNWNPIS